ncbi:hypothetical protein [Chryseolinea lacunae]|uniref:Uncharacterized protein n=1 Tax=Chryseolinea lacunae TaxID=2801331 RepID=A0ABS1KRD9_9BACT|nr:hypothetical protein [Chryseolinea lacunae]MBL0742014.1 hypothetical protein [Chryseolinea lacunae]
MKKIIQGVATIGFIILASFLSLVVISYFYSFIYSTMHPGFRNLPLSSDRWVRLIVIISAVSDFFVLRHLLRKLKQHVGGTWR